MMNGYVTLILYGHQREKTCLQTLTNKGITKPLTRLCDCAGWSAPLLLATPIYYYNSNDGKYADGDEWVGHIDIICVSTLHTLSLGF